MLGRVCHGPTPLEAVGEKVYFKFGKYLFICARDAFEYSPHFFDLVKARATFLSCANTAGCPRGKHGNAPV